ncbi:hypothetical protein QF022_002059 [Vogesella perlucida]|nr:hypothetical protein [Vogesella perlucida]
MQMNGECLLGEMMLGEQPFTDSAPYSPARFA